MGAGFAGGGIAAAGVEGGFEAAVGGFDDGFIFALDAVEACAGAAIESVGFPDVGEEVYLGEIDGKGADDVDGKAPGIEVEHEVGEEPVVEGGDVLIRGLESFRVFVRIADLQDAVGERLGAVAAIVESIVERGMDVGDVEAFKIVVDVEGPVGADGIFAVARGIGLELIDREKAEAIEHWFKYFLQRRDWVERGE